jgi:hypothetical protein
MGSGMKMIPPLPRRGGGIYRWLKEVSLDLKSKNNSRVISWL